MCLSLSLINVNEDGDKDGGDKGSEHPPEPGAEGVPRRVDGADDKRAKPRRALVGYFIKSKELVFVTSGQ